jgi:D-arabinose 1-dehydrogenase-like Zn-dependent alcohol dehydrogenase
MTGTMKAVVFKGPHKIVVEDRPIPTIVDPTDVIIKVSYTALCGRLVAIPSALSMAMRVELR